MWTTTLHELVSYSKFINLQIIKIGVKVVFHRLVVKGTDLRKNRVATQMKLLLFVCVPTLTREESFPCCRKKRNEALDSGQLPAQTSLQPGAMRDSLSWPLQFVCFFVTNGRITYHWKLRKGWVLFVCRWCDTLVEKKMKGVEECNRAHKRDSSRFQVLLPQSSTSEQAKSAHAMLASQAKPHWILMFTIYIRTTLIRFLCQHVNARPRDNRDEAVARIKGPHKHALGRVSVCCLWLADGAGHSWHKNTCVSWRKWNANLQCDALKVVRGSVNAGQHICVWHGVIDWRFKRRIQVA